jgi:hypothetical protein
MEIDATGLSDRSFGRITQAGYVVPELRDDINLFPGVSLTGG